MRVQSLKISNGFSILPRKFVGCLCVWCTCQLTSTVVVHKYWFQFHSTHSHQRQTALQTLTLKNEEGTETLCWCVPQMTCQHSALMQWGGVHTPSNSQNSRLYTTVLHSTLHSAVYPYYWCTTDYRVLSSQYYTQRECCCVVSRTEWEKLPPIYTKKSDVFYRFLK